MKRTLVYAALALLPIYSFNCSKMSSADRAPAASGGGGGNGGLIDLNSPALNTFIVGTDGTIQVWQDKELRYSPSGGAAGPYTISGLPTWATFDASTGTIIGVPRKLTDTATFTITKSGGTRYGPYRVTIVGDTLKEQQWHLINTGQAAFALTPGSSGQDIHYTDSVKNNILGGGVKIAISDSGAYVAHPDLKPNNLVNENRSYTNNFQSSQTWLGDPTPAANSPGDAHGTAVSGLAVAKGWNGIGGRGMAPEAKFAAFKFLQAQDALASAGLVLQGLYDQFAGTFDIYNYSWGDAQCALTEYEQSYTDKLASGVTTQRNGRGAIYMMASGNSFTEDVSDCYSNVAANTDFVLGNVNFSELNTTPYVINVAAVNAFGLSASYSTPGSANWIASTGGEYGWSMAEAGAPEASEPALISTDYPGCNNGLSSLDKAKSSFDNGTNNANCEYTNTMNGTSGATPVATGAAALMLQTNPNLTWRDVKYILAKTADKVNPTFAFPNHPATGFNLTGHTYELPWVTNAAGMHFQNWYGFGRINVDAAVTMAKNYASGWGPFRSTNWRTSGTISVAIPDNSATGAGQTATITDSMVIEAVQIRASISNCAGDMGIELTSPSGTKSYLMNINSKLRDGAILNHVFLSNAFLGEPSAGNWTLRVIDGRATCTANLTNWQLQFHGH